VTAVSAPVTRIPQRLTADPARVIARLFVPGQEGFDHQDSRAAAVVARIMALDEDTVLASVHELLGRFAPRHRDLRGTFLRHASELVDRLDPAVEISDERMLLMGATFTNEYAIEGAAVCNPSMVAHPDQRGVAHGSVRFVMSVRGIGEGHRSSIGFRTGIIDETGHPHIDPAAGLATVGDTRATTLEAAVFRAELSTTDAGEAADFVLDGLGGHFTRAELDAQLARLLAHRSTRGRARQVVDIMAQFADRFYAVGFDSQIPLPERVLWPAMPVESQGMEDARFARFVDDNGSSTYYATYTAYSGSHISQQLLQTDDFQRFTTTPMVGRAASNKGLALFPRRIGGRYAALSRADRESNAIAFSDHPNVWTQTSGCQRSREEWEVMHLGNCGSPIETEAGWLVLTHGVGPMRTYRMGALVLDLDDPTQIVGRLRDPLIEPAVDEQNGYVPNVVYSCGAMVHADTLVVPYGIGDAAIGMATIPVPELLAAFTG
jgi:predicted GH43/DUF377 family glycosyl hydrolase